MLANIPPWLSTLPAVNATLNGLATILLIVGFTLIKQQKRGAHKTVMLSAFAVSGVFLACYLTYHFGMQYYTGEASKKFLGQGPIRYVYYTILLTHVLLAMYVPVGAIGAIYHGLKQQWDSHKRWVKYAYPIWLYVSVTGVLIYFMLYHWPQGA